MTTKWLKKDWSNWSISGFLLFVVQLTWALFFLRILLLPIFFILEITGTIPVGMFELPARINLLDFEKVYHLDAESMSAFHDSVMTVQINTLGTTFSSPWYYYLAFFLHIGLLGAILYGLTLTKRILRSLQRQEPWQKENSENLKILGWMMLLAVPYKYGIDWLSYLTVQQLALPENISLLWPSAYWEIGLAGLVTLIVAYIFEEGTRLYEEQRLTV